MNKIKPSTEDLAFIRSLSNIDLTMFINELHEFGWRQEVRTVDSRNFVGGKPLLDIMREAFRVRGIDGEGNERT